MTWAKAGKRCVCINDDWGRFGLWVEELHIPNRVPMLNEVLTVKSVDFEPGKGLMFTFLEIDERQRDGNDLRHIEADISWSIYHFKPLTSGDLKADIAIFAPILEAMQTVQ